MYVRVELRKGGKMMMGLRAGDSQLCSSLVSPENLMKYVGVFNELVRKVVQNTIGDTSELDRSEVGGWLMSLEKGLKLS